MQQSGYIEIGNHTHDYHWRGNDNSEGYEAMTTNITKEGADITDKEREQFMIDDLTHAHNLIKEHVGVDSVAFAYPYGEYDDLAESVVEKAGYKVVHTTERGLNYSGEDSRRLKRLGIMSAIDAERLLDTIEKID